MSTRSRIAIKTEGGFHSIYCHNDGYPSGVGDTLRKHYTDPAKIDALIVLGHISALGQEVTPPPGVPHSFDKCLSGVTVAYGRDRQEKDIDPEFDATIEALLTRADKCDAEYVYVFDGNWTFTAVGEVRTAIGIAYGPAPKWTPLIPIARLPRVLYSEFIRSAGKREAPMMA